MGTLARKGPEKRPITIAQTPHRLKNSWPFSQQLGMVFQRPHRLDLLVVVVAQPVGQPIAERGADGRRRHDGPEDQRIGGADDRANTDQHGPERQDQRDERQRFAERQHEHDERRPVGMQTHEVQHRVRKFGQPRHRLLPRLPHAGPSKARGGADLSTRAGFCARGLSAPVRQGHAIGCAPARFLLIPRLCLWFPLGKSTMVGSRGGSVGYRVPSSQAGLCRQVAGAAGVGRCQSWGCSSSSPAASPAIADVIAPLTGHLMGLGWPQAWPCSFPVAGSGC